MSVWIFLNMSYVSDVYVFNIVGWLNHIGIWNLDQIKSDGVENKKKNKRERWRGTMVRIV